MEYLSRSRLPIFTPRLDLTAEDLNAEAETICAAINELAGRLHIIKDMIPEDERIQFAEEASYPILDELNRIQQDLLDIWKTIAEDREASIERDRVLQQNIDDLEDRINKLVEAVKQELLQVISNLEKKLSDEDKRIEDKFDAETARIETKFDEETKRIEDKFDAESERIEDKFDTEMSDLERRFNALDDAAARKADVATLFDRIKFIQENSLPSIGTDGYWYIGKVKTKTIARGPQGENGATFTPRIDANGNVSWTNDKGLPNPATVNVRGPQGIEGKQGIQGRQGAVFTPSVNAAGDISWTNADGLPNPKTTNIRGPKGTDGAAGRDGISPRARVTQTRDITTISVTDAEGTSEATIDLSAWDSALIERLKHLTTIDEEELNNSLDDVLGG